nr:14639_t:CDS:1 [Entrophospora candida]
MVYMDKCPVLSDIEWRDNCQFPVIRKGKTPSDWIKQIWDQLMNYKNNNCLTDDKKRYLIARKMKYLWEGDLGHAVGVSIAICHSCNNLIYSRIGSGYECGFPHFMDKHWSTNCTGNAYCDISHKDYMELKSRSEASNSYFEKDAIHCYELWMSNAIKKIQRAREVGKKIRAVNIISQKWLEYMYRPDGLCASQLAEHYKLLWAVREEMRQVSNV